MNWKTFFAMLARDAHVARRNAIQLLMQTFLQPLLFVFIFGKVMVGSGYMPRGLQESSAARNHRDQHGLHRSVGGGYAADRRISVDSRN